MALLRVAFDFDGTICRGDSIDGWYAALGGRRRDWAALEKERWAKRLRIRSETDVKRVGFQRFMRGRTREQLTRVAQDYVATLPVHQAVVERLDHHLALGHEVFLVTASWEVYVRHFRPDAITIGTGVRFSPSGRATGMEVHCMGEEKVRLLAQRYGVTHVDEAYTDSWTDLPLLTAADRAFLVRNDQITPLDCADIRARAR